MSCAFHHSCHFPRVFFFVCVVGVGIIGARIFLIFGVVVSDGFIEFSCCAGCVGFFVSDRSV